MDRVREHGSSLFGRLIDDAGLFPPAALSMSAALARHRDAVATGNPMLTGRFVCVVEHVELHGRELTAAGIPLSVVVDGKDVEQMLTLERAGLRADGLLEAVELDARDLTDPEELERTIDAARKLSGVEEVYVEVGWGPAFAERLAVVGRTGARGKLRCGGVWESAFPAVSELAAALTALAREDVAWKATAGLHSAVRGVDQRDGQVHHGFLNLLLATEAATAGASASRVVELLSTGDGQVLANAARSLSAGAVERTRAALVSYGSCDIQEPLDELARLGLPVRGGEARSA